MGQYFKVVNLDKEEEMNPHDFLCGAKLPEMMGGLIMYALALLLADGSGRNEFDSDSPLIGSWAGDRIVIVGDYAKSGLYDSDYRNISEEMIRLLYREQFYREWLEQGAFESEPERLRQILAAA